MERGPASAAVAGHCHAQRGSEEWLCFFVDSAKEKQPALGISLIVNQLILFSGGVFLVIIDDYRCFILSIY